MAEKTGTGPAGPAPQPAPGTAAGGFLHRHPRVARLLLALLVPVLLLGGLEGGLRLFGYGYPTALFLPVEAADAWGMNRRFGWRFFPREISRAPIPQGFPLEKTEGTCRVFTLGASAALGMPNSAFSFTRNLAVMLESRYPGVRFEVVNTSLTAINSHVVRPIALDVAGHEPDVAVVYLGNNEVIGPFGIGSSPSGEATPRALARATIALKARRLGQLLAALARPGDVDTDQWRGMAMYSRHLAGKDSPALARVRGSFAANLADICDALTGAGARVVLSTVPVNLRNSPPFNAAADSTLPGPVRARRDRLVDAALRGMGAGAAEAPAVYDTLRLARAIDPGDADIRFLLGRAALALGAIDSARTHFEAALERDALRFRADAAINGIIRDTAARLAPAGVLLADTERLVRDTEPSGTGIPGREMFYEHVHLTFTGNYLVARALLPTVERALPAWVRERAAPDRPVPTPEDCARALLYTPAAEFLALSQIRTTVTPYPFTAQLGHQGRLAAMDRRVAELQREMTPEFLQAVIAAYRQAWQRDPRDLLLGVNFSWLLSLAGDEAGGREIMRRVMETQPPAGDLQWLETGQLAGGG